MADSLKFYNVNLIDNATMTASTTNAQFPTSNLLDSRRTKVYRSTTNSDNIVFDFGSAQTINSFFIVSNSVTGFGIAGITLELNATDSWGAPSFSQAITFSSTHGCGYADFANQSFRYARLVLTSSLGYCELSSIFIGQSLTIGNYRGPNFNWNYVNKDNSKIASNRYDQRFVDILPRQKSINFQMSLLSKDDMDDIFELYDLKGTRKPFFVRLGCVEMSNDVRRTSGMFYFNSVPTITNTTFNRYSLSLNIEEAM